LLWGIGSPYDINLNTETLKQLPEYTYSRLAQWEAMQPVNLIFGASKLTSPETNIQLKLKEETEPDLKFELGSALTSHEVVPDRWQ
jgi:hypothetical protein